MTNKLKNVTFDDGFSVLMAVYGGDNDILLSKAIESVASNSLLPKQFLIVIDGPVSDEINKVLINARDALGYIDLVYLPRNMGLALALNEGLSYVKFPWVVRADADDFNHADRFYVLAKEVSADPSIDLLGSSIVETDESATPVFCKPPPLLHSHIVSYMKYRNPFNHMSVAFRLVKVIDVGGYPNIYLKEDYALWASLIASNARVKNIPDVLISVNAGESMYARRGGFRYAKSEITMQIFLVKCGIQSFLMALVIGLVRSSIFLMPNLLRGWVYKNLLRRRV
jgi:glycosyltransferase involved in cell wall biosynthesis